MQKKARLEYVLKQYSKPILLAASDLQDRLWHLTETVARTPRSQKQLLVPAKNKGQLLADEAESYTHVWPMTPRHYLVGTVYLFARYFAWIEILKREVQFLEGSRTRYTRRFAAYTKTVERALAENRELYDKLDITVESDRPIFQLQQVYIGERLIVAESHQERPLCLEFAEFYDDFDTFAEAPDFSALSDLIIRAAIRKRGDFCLTRCRLTNDALVNLIQVLDPKSQYLPPQSRAYTLPQHVRDAVLSSWYP
jgi:hypothetical protein